MKFIDTEDEAPDRPPDETIVSGLCSWEGATSLDLYREEGHTLIVPVGEEYNAESFVVEGHPSAVEVRAEYVKVMEYWKE